MKQFLFSFVIPAYNVKPYFVEAVESVLAQTVGFTDNIQIVLVNDGSTDETGALCAEYRDKYPDNIIYIDQPHGGVSAARNAGLKAATGRYIGFLDADDKWDAEACQAALDFFKKHPDVNIACSPITLFGAGKGEHWLNFKFGKAARVVNIAKNPDCAVQSVCACFIRKEAVQDRFFDESLPVYADFLWIARLLLSERNFGLLSGPRYHFRQRPDQTSVLERQTVPAYLESLRLCHLELLCSAPPEEQEEQKEAPSWLKKGLSFFQSDESQPSQPQTPEQGEAPAWVQYAVLLDLLWRIREEDKGLLTAAQKEEYRAVLRDCLTRIDDQLICTVRHFWAEDRLSALALKYDKSYEEIKEWVKADDKEKLLCFCPPEAKPLPLARPWDLKVESIACTNQLLLRGSCAVLISPPERMKLVLTAELPDGSVQDYPCTLDRRPDLKKQYFFTESLWAREGFEVALPLADLIKGTKARAEMRIDGRGFALDWAHVGQSPFAKGQEESYQARNGSVLAKLPENQGLLLEEIGSRELLFSFIIPAWNAESSLAAAVESVLAQSVGFEENIQLVLVNDGSTDGTAALCEEYRKRYPANIVYLEQPQAGVSAARNAGLQAATGRFLAFLDADDTWDKEACQTAQDFFEKHPWVHVACFPIRFFGQHEGEHPFNEKFKGLKASEVAQIFKDPDFAVFGPCSCFFESAFVRERLFAEPLPISEDCAWMAKLLLDLQDFGLLPKPSYRKGTRAEQDASVAVEENRLAFYLDLPRQRHLEIFRHATEKYGEVPQWAQSVVLPDLAQRIREKDEDVLTAEQKAEYQGLMRECLASVDDELLLSSPEFGVEERLCALALKYGVSCGEVKEWIKADEREAALLLCRPDARPQRFCAVPPLRVEVLELAKGRFLVQGLWATLAPRDRMQLVFEVEYPDGDRRSYPCELVQRADAESRILFEEEASVFEHFEQSIPFSELVDGVKVRAIARFEERSFSLVWQYEGDSPFAQEEGKEEDQGKEKEKIEKYQTKKGGIISKLANDKGVCIDAVGEGEFLFSFVIPAYNVKRYVSDAVESVIAQTIGFKENIQIVLVNDGSTDGTGAVCKRYRDLYPDNIIYIEKPNGGVSSARNAGMRVVTGKYINFLDADDKWDAGVCKAAFDFFKKNPTVNVACFPIMFFGRQTGTHWLNYTHTKNIVANIFSHPNHGLYLPASCFINKECINDIFDETLPYCEDQKFLVKIIIDQQNFLMLSNYYYYYRKRFDYSSSVDSQNNFPISYYIDSLMFYHIEMLKYARENYNEIPKWVKHVVMLDLTWRIKERSKDILTLSQKNEYYCLMRSCLAQIDDQIICTVRNLWAEERLCALAIKYDMTYEQMKEWVKPDKEKEALCFCYPRATPLLLTQPWNLRVEFMDIAEEGLLLRGSVPVMVSRGRMTLFLEVEYPGGSVQDYPCKLFRRPDKRKDFFFENGIWAQESFELSLPLTDMTDGIKVQSFVMIDGMRFNLKWLHDKLSPFLRGNEASYLERAGYIISKLLDNEKPTLQNGLFVESCTSQCAQKREQRFLLSIARQKTDTSAMLVARIREVARRIRRLTKKPIWLICDRITFAGDSGEALFEYLMTNSEARQGVRPIFALSKDSADWERLKALGPTVSHGSVLHKVLFLAADKIISSHADSGVINPFGSDDWWYRDLFNFDFVYLEHGVMLADVSRYLNRADKNIALFVTSAERERQAVVSGDFGYAPEQVKLTGQPRHDVLFRRAAMEKTQRLLALMPTWRSFLDVGFDPVTGSASSNPAFTASKYFQFWNALINHPRLLENLCEYGYRLRFSIHPRCIPEADKFRAQEPVEIVTYSDSTKNVCEAALLVTDYSSTACEFALLKKPIIYAQFDADEFFSGRHSYDKGYFEYERDGFGPVCEDLETTADAVIRYLENGCEMESLYRERVDTFFGPQPENRCQAVVDAIKQLGRRQK